MTKITPSASSRQNQPKSGPPQFLINAADAVNTGQYDKAIDVLKQGIDQDNFAAYKGIGDICLFRGENEQAMEWLEKARECKPESVTVLESIGQALVGLGRKDEAVEKFRMTIKQQKNMENVRSMVKAMHEMGLTDKAIEVMEEAIDADSPRPEIMFELAWFFEKIGQLSKAEEWYKKNAELKPNYEAYNQLGLICRKMGRIPEAVEYMRKTVTLKPDFGGGWENLALFLMDFGNIEESIELSRTIVDKIHNDSRFHSNFLLRLHYSPNLDQQAIFEEHKKWGQRYAPTSMAKVSHSNKAEPERKLRIGYISPDFQMHVAACHITTLLDAHNRDVVEVYGYGNVECPDQITVNLQNKFDRYRNIWEVSDEAVARIIEQDKIDILVELAGHSKGNRLLVLAYKPAPIQVTYLGYYDTTGMKAVDYLLTDIQTVPPESQKFYTEQLVYLPGGIICYAPLGNAPAVTPLPATENGYITFGAFTKIWRLNRRILEVWAEILKLTSNSKLLLGFRGGDDKEFQHRFLRQFEQYGVSRDRITICGLKPYLDYLKQYNDVDITLDTFPENGGTTTCDALWMGIPVISLVGRHQVERYSISAFSRIGMEYLVASTPSEYAANAVTLASKPEKLMEIRASIRPKMADSSLCNTKRFAQEIESAYRKMWYQWCRKQGVSVPPE